MINSDKHKKNSCACAIAKFGEKKKKHKKEHNPDIIIDKMMTGLTNRLPDVWETLLSLENIFCPILSHKI